MHGRRFDRILTGTAIALVLGLASAPAIAQTSPNSSAIEALVPVPEPADVPPPTAADVGGPTTGTTGTATAITLPDPPDLPPPTFKDVAVPAAPAVTPPPATTAAPAIAPAAAPVVVSADQPVMDALRDLVSTKLSRIIERKNERTAVEAFYSARNYEPIWIANGAASERAKAAIEHLNNADADGMEPSDYPTPVIKAGTDPAALAEAEIRLTSSALNYARQAQMGRIHYSRVSADIVYTQVAPEPVDVLAKLAAGKDTAAVLNSYQPPQSEYKALRKKLAEARGKSDAAPAKIAGGPVLSLVRDKRGAVTLMRDDRVPDLRAKLGLAEVKGDDFFDKPLSDAVAAFQKGKGLRADGRLTDATVDALNGKRRDRDDAIIIANMERWRWVPRDLGKQHVVLNIPDYTLQVYNNGASIWKTRVVVGKPGTHATPLLSETMKYITVNPTWNVPPSIVYNEYLPALQQDPTVLKRMGLSLTQNRDGSVHISQPPGERNALGRIRFNFPNKFLVYQHDTPDKHLFAHDKRAYSHGCMRVQEPDKYAEVLLGLTLPGQNYTRERIRSMYGNSEIDIKFPTPIPVHITYQTAFVDDAGHLQIRDDVYGRDQRLIAALKGEERRFAEVPVQHSQPNYSRPSVRLPSGVGSSDQGYSGGQSFFDRLFGNPIQPASQPPQRRASRSTTR